MFDLNLFWVLLRLCVCSYSVFIVIIFSHSRFSCPMLPVSTLRLLGVPCIVGGCLPFVCVFVSVFVSCLIVIASAPVCIVFRFLAHVFSVLDNFWTLFSSATWTQRFIFVHLNLPWSLHFRTKFSINMTHSEHSRSRRKPRFPFLVVEVLSVLLNSLKQQY